MNSFSVHIKLSYFIEHYKTLESIWSQGGLMDLAVSNCNKFVASGSGDFCIGIVSDWHSSLQHLVASNKFIVFKTLKCFLLFELLAWRSHACALCMLASNSS